MLDASSSEAPKNKKKTPQTRPLQRFWPDSLACSVSQQQVTMEDGMFKHIVINKQCDINNRRFFGFGVNGRS